jgi:hypothetical protein
VSNTVITGLVPVIPLRDALCPPKRDGRVKPGHDKARGLGMTPNLSHSGRLPAATAESHINRLNPRVARTAAGAASCPCQPTTLS